MSLTAANSIPDGVEQRNNGRSELDLQIGSVPEQDSLNI